MNLEGSRSITEQEFNTMHAALLKQVGDYYDSEIGPKLPELQAKKLNCKPKKPNCKPKKPN